MTNPANSPDVHTWFSKRIRGLKLRIAVLAVLEVFVLGYLTWIYTEIGKNDAPAVVAIAGDQIQANLPAMETALGQQLVEMAPGVVDAAGEELLKLPASLRESAQQRVDEWSASRLPGYQARVRVLVDEAVAAGVVTLNESGSGSPEQRVEAAVGATIDHFAETLGEFFTATGETYRSDIQDLVTRLDRLAAGRGLTEREQLQRHLIQATLALGHRVRSGEIGR